ncbi:MAG: heptosyltransferase III [bacterium]|nr:MAG: heptosyltransferase III [bacterium]
MTMIHPFKDVKKILVIKLRHIGDVLLTVPLFRALKENFPNSHISALVNSGTEEMLTGNPLIDEIIVFDRVIEKMSTMQKYIEELTFLRSIRQKNFDMTVDLTNGDRAAIISFLSRARYRLAYTTYKGFAFKRYLYTHLAQNYPHMHMVKHNLDILGQNGLSCQNTSLFLDISDLDRDFIRGIIGIKQNIVHVHPTASLLHKCWKDEYMADVISWLVRQGKKVVVTSSPDKKETDKAKRILSLVFSRLTHDASQVIDLCGKTTIKQLAAISEASDLFFGIDSAPMHIASAVGTPVVAIFGPSSETLWEPWCEKKLVISKNLPCRLPCKNKGNCQTHECINSIMPGEVITKIEGFMRGIN